MEDEMQEKKQNYLREMIMEAGYDANEFVEFLMQKKGEDATDVNIWSFPELKEVGVY